MMARWGDEKTMNFIYLYRQRECLWNISSPLYKNRLAREYAYQSILQQFNDSQLDLKSVKTKIKNLRSVYHTELKKVKDTSRYGSDGSVYRPSLSWFDEMHAFLGDLDERERFGAVNRIKRENRIKNEPEASSADENATLSLQDSDAEHITIDATPEPDIYLDQPEGSDSNSCNNMEITPSSPSTQQFKPKMTRKIRPHTDNTVLNALQRLENKVANVINKNSTSIKRSHTNNEDEFHMFALSVAAQLRQLPLHIAIATQSKIQNTLSEARLSSIFSNRQVPNFDIKQETIDVNNYLNLTSETNHEVN